MLQSDHSWPAGLESIHEKTFKHLLETTDALWVELISSNQTSKTKVATIYSLKLNKNIYVHDTYTTYNVT